MTIRSLLAWPRRPESDIRDDGRAAVEQVLGLFGAARQETDWNELKPCFGERCKLRDAVGSEELAALGPEVRGFVWCCLAGDRLERVEPVFGKGADSVAEGAFWGNGSLLSFLVICRGR